MNFLIPIPEIEKDSNYDKYLLRNKELVWGVSQKLKGTFDKIKPQDLVFFYHRKKIISIGNVERTETNMKYSLSNFGTKHKKTGEIITYPHLIFFSKVYKCELDFELLKSELGYRDKFYVRRLIPINKKLKIDNDLSLEKNISQLMEKYSVSREK